MTDLPYITYRNFCDKVRKNIYIRDLWDMIDEEGKQLLYEQVHSIVDTEYDYIGRSVNGNHAFPRDFSAMINATDGTYTDSQLAFLRTNQRKYPIGIDIACIKLGQDLLQLHDYNTLIKLDEKLGTTKIQSGSAITIDKSTKKISQPYSNEVMRVLNKFRPTYFALGGV